MRALRRHLAFLIGAWLVCQVAVLGAAPLALCQGQIERTADDTCTCAHYAGQQCPMHHRTATPSKSSCSCRSTTDPDSITMASLLGPSAVLPPGSPVVAPIVQAAVAAPLTATLLGSPQRPDAPPPRA